MVSIDGPLLLVIAGVAAGTVGTAGGVTSLISYPALLAVGVSAQRADVANIVAVVACWPGAALASRPELAGQRSWLQRWAVVAAVGGAFGSVLLLVTPHQLFARIVPVLVGGAAIAMLLQPRLTRWRDRGSSDHRGVLVAGLLLASIYNGYFGAGAGIMVLAVLLVFAERRMAVANALKNMLIGVASVVSAVGLVIFSRIDWSAVVPLSAGMFAGSMIGPRASRVLPPNILRPLVAICGIALAIVLWRRNG